MTSYKLPINGVDACGLLLRAAVAFAMGDWKEAGLSWWIVQYSRTHAGKRFRPLVEWE